MSSAAHRALTVDRGNSRVKMRVMEGLTSLYAYSGESPDIEQAARICDEYGVDTAIYCSVGAIDARFAESLRRLTDDRLLVLTHETPLPVTIDYGSPATLGADRIAALCGARILWPDTAMLVADAGTCLTLDLLDAAGHFPGGDIAPGVEMRLKAMHSFTGSLPEVGIAGELPEYGTDTATAMRCGAVRGAADQIIHAWQEARRLAEARRLVLTGGDADMLLPLLQSEIDHIDCRPDLIEVGLISILKYNEYI